MVEVIVADVREEGSGVLEALEKIGIHAKVEQLSVADFVVSSNCAVERKTASDFFGSLYSGRLFEQAQRLSSSYQIPLMIIEGDFAAEVEEHRNPKAPLGAIVSLSVTYGLRVIFTRDVEQTADVLAMVQKHHQIEPRSEIIIQKKPRFHSDTGWQKFIVSSFPRVGPVLAERLLLRFHSVKGIVNANAAQLATMQGLPKNTAKELHRIVTLSYKPTKDTKQTKLTS